MLCPSVRVILSSKLRSQTEHNIRHFNREQNVRLKSISDIHLKINMPLNKSIVFV